MKLSRKVSYSLASMLAIILVTVSIGLYSTHSLSSLLNFITTSAWDTADGAMEGSIGIKAQMLAVERLTSGKSNENKLLLKKGEDLAEEALNRMMNAGLMSNQELGEINTNWQTFNKQKQSLLKNYQAYKDTNDLLDSSFSKLHKLMTAGEELGDSEVEKLRKKPNSKISWNSGLSEKWLAADGMMEAQIHFLSVTYHFKNFIHDFADIEHESHINNSWEMLNSLVKQISELNVYQANKYEDISFSEQLTKNLSLTKKHLNQTIVTYKRYLATLESYTTVSDLLIDTLEKIEESGDGKIEGQVSTVSSTQTIAYSLSFISLLIGMALIYLARYRFNSKIIQPIETITRNMQLVADGDSHEANTFTDRDDEVGEMSRALEKFIAVFRDNKRITEESSRLNSAISAASTNLMIADSDLNIVYMNPAVQNMMQLAESDLKEALPHFQAKDLVGKNIDVFHKDPSHQRMLLDKLSKTYKTNIHVGKRTFCLIATPIFDDAKMRIGTVVEWNDKTAEEHIEREVSELIIAANKGDLSKRLNSEGQNEFVGILSKGLNELLDKVSGFVEDVGSLFQAMSDGDLRKRISNIYQGELDVIRNNANSSVTKLDDALVKIRNASDIVNSSAYEVAQGSDDLSQRTESQASSLEETAASMLEITETVKQTAESAKLSDSLAKEAIQKAEKGGEVVQGAVHAMSDIMGASNKINDIIGVIDEIAFQTNLLALNAAVEAARAGEQGRGFAVVAAEVRSLSQRSASAAKEIKELIRDSVHKVESGAKLVNESGLMLSEIVQSVDKVAKMIGDVTAAAVEQNEGINQINKAVTLMDEMTQKNAALVEETSAASRSMSEEASSMSQLISFFHLSHITEMRTPSSHTPSNVSSTNVSSSRTDTSEKIKKYQPNKPEQKPFNTEKHKGNNSAASFSDDEDWEDF